jgi:hypothetical protein
MKLKGMFSRYQPLSGRDWLASLSEEDRKAFGEIGHRAVLRRNPAFHKKGGKARSEAALRCKCGAFVGKSDAYRLILGEECWHNHTQPYTLVEEIPVDDFPF